MSSRPPISKTGAWKVRLRLHIQGGVFYVSNSRPATDGTRGWKNRLPHRKDGHVVDRHCQANELYTERDLKDQQAVPCAGIRRAEKSLEGWSCSRPELVVHEFRENPGVHSLCSLKRPCLPGRSREELIFHPAQDSPRLGQG